MTPTQAQIEAAARAMFDLEYKLMGSDWVIPKWDESYRSYWGPLASAALAAAAEVGCGIKDPPCTFDEGYKYKEAECKEEIAATIERCIKAVWDAGGDNAEFHCDAIRRALKDKP